MTTTIKGSQEMLRLSRRTVLGASLGGWAAAALIGCKEGASPGTDGGPLGADGGATAFDGGEHGTADAGSIDAGSLDASALDSGSLDAGAETCAPTPPDLQGPFHRRGAPSRTALVGPDEPGELLEITGEVVGPDCRPLAGVVLDVWQADATGAYDNRSQDFRLRALLETDEQGRYAFTTVKPGNYPDAGGMRPAHIHFTVIHPGYRPLTTQLYFAGDPFLAPVDSCRPCNSGAAELIIELLEENRGGEPWLSGHFRVVLGR